MATLLLSQRRAVQPMALRRPSGSAPRVAGNIMLLSLHSSQPPMGSSMESQRGVGRRQLPRGDGAGDTVTGFLDGGRRWFASWRTTRRCAGGCSAASPTTSRTRSAPSRTAAGHWTPRPAPLTSWARRQAGPPWTTVADSLAELGQCIGVDGEAMVATVARFNAEIERGHDDEFGRGDSTYDNVRGDRSSTAPWRTLRAVDQPAHRSRDDVRLPRRAARGADRMSR